jgi:hypothetical protein
MKILLDENLPRALRNEIADHAVSTVQQMGWSGTKNGLLLQLAAAEAFDALIILDSGLEHQQNLSALPLAVIILSAASNDIEDLRPVLPRLREALSNLKPKTLVRV